jgi:hypothetical protein
MDAKNFRTMDVKQNQQCSTQKTYAYKMYSVESNTYSLSILDVTYSIKIKNTVQYVRYLLHVQFTWSSLKREKLPSFFTADSIFYVFKAVSTTTLSSKNNRFRCLKK